MTAAVLGPSAPAGVSGTRLSRALVALTAVAFVAANATLVGSHSMVKLGFLGLFVAAGLVQLFLAGRFVAYPRLIGFYLAVAVTSCIVALAGLLNSGASAVASMEGVRVYGAWSMLFVVVFTLLRSTASLRLIHRGLVVAGILITAINGFAIADQFLRWGMVSAGTREAMSLMVGLNADGVVRINSTNITALFVIVPYLLALQFRADSGEANSWLTKAALVLTLVITALSGRRALWLVVVLTPLIIILIAVLSGTVHSLRRAALRATVALGLIAGAVFVTAPLRPPAADEPFFVRHVREAFSGSDERNLQVGYLLDGFADAPVWGSGFGGFAGYRRSDVRPWSYELSYVQLLFNAGLVGVTLIGTLYAIYLVHVIRLLRRPSGDSAVPFALLVGVVSLLLGASSNPYMGAFDNLFHVGLLPYLATFRSGFSS